MTVAIKGLPDSSIDSTADFSEITMSPGETRTLSLTWDRVDLVPDCFVPGDVELCVEADRDGVPGVQAEDCTTVTVKDAITYDLTQSASVSDADAGGNSVVVENVDVTVSEVRLSYDFDANSTIFDDTATLFRRGRRQE